MTKPQSFTFIVGPALGHVARVLSVVSEISQISDAQITLISPDTRPYLAQLANDRHDVRLVAIEKGKPGFVSFAPGLEDYFDKNPCDLIILDLDPLMWISTTRFPDVPQVYITNIFLTGLSDRDTFQKINFCSFSKRINEIREDKGLRTLSNIKELYDRDLVLLADPFEVVRLHGHLPGNYLPVGPCSLDTGDLELPEELLSVNDVLLISFGSTGDIKLAGRAIEALLQHHRFEAVIWVGGEPAYTDTTAVPLTFAYPWLPLKALLPKTKLVLTHGGTGSTYQALEAGKPVICCPTSSPNHRILSSLIEEQHLGVSIENDHCVEKLSDLDLKSLEARVQRVAAAQSSRFGGPGAIAKRLVDYATSGRLGTGADEATPEM